MRNNRNGAGHGKVRNLDIAAAVFNLVFFSLPLRSQHHGLLANTGQRGSAYTQKRSS